MEEEGIMLRSIAASLIVVSAFAAGADDTPEPNTPVPSGSIEVSVSGPAQAPVIELRTADRAWSVPVLDAARDGRLSVSRSAEDPSYTIVTILADAPPPPSCTKTCAPRGAVPSEDALAGVGVPAKRPQPPSGTSPRPAG
jgi:hypothetical protein